MDGVSDEPVATEAPAPDPDRFAAEGYQVLPGLFSAAEVDAVLQAVEAARTPEDDANELSLGAMRFVSNLFRRSPAIRALLIDDRILALVRAFVGPDAWCRWDQAVAKGPGAGSFPWHQDNGYSHLPVAHLQIWVALTPSHPDTGGLWVEPGGHLRPDREHRWVGDHVELVEPVRDPVAISAEPGDVIAFSSHLPHHTSPHRGGPVRWTYVAEVLPTGVEDPQALRPHLELLRHGEAVVVGPDWPASAPPGPPPGAGA